ncbi:MULTISPECIES: hypothetical protein [unclassified Sphingomonas]|uniref:hypothetical protein n=1 Tax=unclassified Sphingomonas TaxID=196159 RepID=UPI0007005D7C|nr:MULTISPECIES: hypothetical protein [unclassified Sphingomonas]KQN03248.1 hypothetical protein ASE82_06705 [Sphingomonas sp. Leaf230]TCM10314.1 hypothetical protein C8J41_101828 [Sphingomonas sp. PP-CC-3G-468]
MGIKSKAAGNAKVGGLVVTGGKNRVLVARKPRAKEWTLERQATFLEELAMTGNVTTSVVVVGMSLGGAYHRRSHDPAFAAAWQAALSRGYDRLEELLLATSLASLDRDDGRLGGQGDDDPRDGGVEAPRNETAAVGDAGAVEDVGAVEEGGGEKIWGGAAVPGAGLIKLSSVTAIQFALAMLNQHRAREARGRQSSQTCRATSVETDAALLKLLDSLARRQALVS